MELLICPEPTSNRWKLGKLPVLGATTLLVGWRTETPVIDGGIPDFVGRVIAQAMAETAWVVFPSTAWTAMPGREDPVVRKAQAGGAKSLLRAAFGDQPTVITTASTRQTAVAATLFDDAGFPWWLGAQTALLFDPRELPRTLDHSTWLALLSDRWAETAFPLASAGLFGAIRAGVDGDILGFTSASADNARIFIDSIARCAQEHDCPCAFVDEDQIG